MSDSSYLIDNNPLNKMKKVKNALNTFKKILIKNDINIIGCNYSEFNIYIKTRYLDHYGYGIILEKYIYTNDFIKNMMNYAVEFIKHSRGKIND